MEEEKYSVSGDEENENPNPDDEHDNDGVHNEEEEMQMGGNDEDIYNENEVRMRPLNHTYSSYVHDGLIANLHGCQSGRSCFQDSEGGKRAF
jgi:hypothetical protein